MQSNTIHTRFKHFIEVNLQQTINEEPSVKLYEAYAEFSKLKWKDKLLENPKDLPPKAKLFLQFV